MAKITAEGIAYSIEDGKETWTCKNCGAKSDVKGWKRFCRRHPVLCTARKQFAKQLAGGTRAVDYDLADMRAMRDVSSWPED